MNALRELESMLAEEATLWHGTVRSKIADRISNYKAAVYLLNLVIRDPDMNHQAICVAVFESRGITIKGIRGCFKGADRGDRAYRLLDGACKGMRGECL